MHAPPMGSRATPPSDTATAAGSKRLAGARHQSQKPPSAARWVTLHADDNNSTDEPGGRQPRQMSPAAEPQQRTKRPRTDRMPIPTILPPTEPARLAELDTHTGTAGATASSSTAFSHRRTNDTVPGPHKPSAAPHTATPISAPSVHPSRNSSSASAPQRQPETPTGATTHRRMRQG